MFGRSRQLGTTRSLQSRYVLPSLAEVARLLLFGLPDCHPALWEAFVAPVTVIPLRFIRNARFPGFMRLI